VAHLRLSSVIRIANIAAIADSNSLVSPVSLVLQRALQNPLAKRGRKKRPRGVRDFPQAAMIRQIPFLSPVHDLIAACAPVLAAFL